MSAMEGNAEGNAEKGDQASADRQRPQKYCVWVGSRGSSGNLMELYAALRDYQPIPQQGLASEWILHPEGDRYAKSLGHPQHALLDGVEYGEAGVPNYGDARSADQMPSNGSDQRCAMERGRDDKSASAEKTGGSQSTSSGPTQPITSPSRG